MTGCEYPENTPVTAYGKGCHCPRCTAANTARCAAWRAANPDKMARYRRTWADKNRDRLHPRHGDHPVTRPKSPAVALADTELQTALHALADVGRRTPCADPARRNWWTSDNPDERTQATKLCELCPAFNACHNVAVARRERWGVWAGRDRYTPPKKAKRR